MGRPFQPKKTRGRRPGSHGLLPRRAILTAYLAVTAALDLAAAALAVRFVRRGRLGRPWLLVAAGLGVMGGFELFKAGSLFAGEPSAITGLEVVEFSVALLFASGFALTERWFALKERIEGRYRLFAEVDRALVGLLDEERILSAVCDGLAQAGDYRLVWVGVAEPDGSVRVARCAGPAQEFLTRIRVRWDETPEGMGPTGRSLRTGAPAVMNLFDEELPAVHWREAVAFGLRSGASVRIDHAGDPKMALTICCGSQKAFDPVETETIRTLANRVGTALLSARRHALFVAAKTAYDDLLRTQRDGIICIRGGRIVRANAAAAAMFGYGDPGQLIGLSPDLLLHEPDSQAGGRALFGAPGGAGDRGDAEALLRRRDGSAFSGELSVTWVPRPDDSRAEHHFRWIPTLSGPLAMVVIRDITPRREAMEAIRRERDFTAKVLETAGALVMEVSPAGEILLFNRQCEEVTGYGASAVIGKRVDDVLLPETSHWRFREAVDDLRAGKPRGDVEYPLLTRSGEERSVLWRHAALRDGEGQIRSVIVAGADVTERRLLEAQVVGMQKMEALGTLAGGIAHDFNNILTGILGNLDIARRELPAGSPPAAPIDESIRASERAAILVRQLLEFSRRSPLCRRAVDLRIVADEVVRLLTKTIDRRIEIGVASDPRLWHASADANQIHQVLMNLCVNARDAVEECLERREGPPPGGYAIGIEMGNARVDDEYCRRFPYARPGEYLRLSVADNGAGMDEATQRRVFEPFFTTKRLGRGTGLGLSTVYGIVKQHEGWVNLESAPGKGTVFRVYIPRAAEDETGEAPGLPGGEGKRGRETILLADDEAMIRELGLRILGDSGYSVIAAADGQEAVDLFLRLGRSVDLVILDMTMPRLSGVEALERIRQIDPQARIILSSGYPAGMGYGSDVATRASGFLQKPYRADDLSRAVRQVLDAGR